MQISAALIAIFAAVSFISIDFGRSWETPSGNTTTLPPEETICAISINFCSSILFTSTEIRLIGSRFLVNNSSNMPPGCHDTMIEPLSDGIFSASMREISLNQLDTRAPVTLVLSPMSMRRVQRFSFLCSFSTKAQDSNGIGYWVRLL